MLSRTSVRALSASTRASSAVRVAARDAPGSSLSSVLVVIDTAGSKLGALGTAHLLAKFGFLNTEHKLALRFTRESELLGGVFSGRVTRDAVVLNAQFLREDLPFYVEALANVVAKPAFRPHELGETVVPAALAEYQVALADPHFVAVEALHAASFRRGYGHPLYYDGQKQISLDDIKQFAAKHVTQNTVRVVGLGVIEEDLKSFVADSAFSTLLKGSAPQTPVELFVGNELRIRKAGASVAAFAVPVKTGDFAKYEVLATALGSAALSGHSTVAQPLAQLPGHAAAQLFKYKDAGLFVVSVTDADSGVVAQLIKQAKKAVDAVSAKDLSGAVKLTQLLLGLQSTFEHPVDVKVELAPKGEFKLKLAEFNYVAVGDVDVLPYADEL